MRLGSMGNSTFQVSAPSTCAGLELKIGPESIHLDEDPVALKAEFTT